jgi:small subunit ribosomal protein S20
MGENQILPDLGWTNQPTSLKMSLRAQHSGLGKGLVRYKLIGGCTLGLKSSQKRERQNEQRRMRNRSYKSKTRTLIKKAFVAIEEGNLEDAKLATTDAVKALDKAAAKGAIHKNNASRRKGRLMTRLASLEKGA